MKLLIDGDIVAYRCAYTSQDDRAEYAGYSASVYLSDLISDIYDQVEGEPDYLVYLTGKGNFRNEIAVTQPYKGNRKDKEKPEHLGYIRDVLVKEWKATISEDEEADDLIAIAMTKEPDSIIVSVDKDFDQLPGLHYNPNKKLMYDVSEADATKFLYLQILMGDRADNIPGIKGVGPKKAEKALEELTTEKEMYDKCVEMYEGDEERVIENARLLFLRREENQLWSPPT